MSWCILNIVSRSSCVATFLGSRDVKSPYNAQGQVLSVSNTLNQTTRFEYYTESSNEYKIGDLSAVINAKGHRTSILAYNAHGQALEMTDANGLTTYFEYDAAGRLTARKVTDGSSTLKTLYGYDAIGQLISLVQPNGYAQYFTYNDARRLVQVADNRGNSIDYSHNANGQVINQGLSKNNQILTSLSKEYDQLGRVIALTNPSNHKWQVVYDNYGETSKRIEPLGDQTNYTYDALKRITQTLHSGKASNNPNSTTSVSTQLAYTAQDALSKATDSKNLSTSFKTNAFALPTQENSVDRSEQKYQYDALGNLQFSTDAKGQKTEYWQDSLNQTVNVIYADKRSTTYVYDTDPYADNPGAVGNLTWACEKDTAGNTEHCTHTIYDKFGRVIKQMQSVHGEEFVTTYAYDAQGNLSRMTYPSGRVVDYKYTPTGELNAITTTHQGVRTVVVENITYYANGFLRTYSLGGNPVEWWVNSNNQISAVTLAPGDLTALEYDANGRLIKQGWNVNYAYDGENRLIELKGSEKVHQATYDTNGNRVSSVSYPVNNPAIKDSKTYGYTTSTNRLASVVGSTPQSISYDAMGNSMSDGARNYTYDAKNLTKVIQRGAVYTEYVRNAANQRISHPLNKVFTVQSNQFFPKLFHAISAFLKLLAVQVALQLSLARSILSRIGQI